MTKAKQNKQFEEAFAPMFAYNTLVVDAAEKTMALQFSMMQKLGKIGFDNAKAMMDIKSADEFKSYAEKQQVVAKEVSEVVANDARALGDLNQHFLDDSRKLVEKNIELAAVKAA